MIVATFTDGPLDRVELVIESVQHELQCAIPEPLPIASPDRESVSVRVGIYRLAQTARHRTVTRANYVWRGVP